MALIDIKNLTFRYPEETHPALEDLSLSLEEGEFVTLCGPSGCGKTTLLRLLKYDIAPVGQLDGTILYNEKSLKNVSREILAQEMGMVFQDPENQIVMDKVMQELVFGMENLGFSSDVMHKRVAEMVHFFGLEPWLHKKTHEISGGQKQIVNLASVLLLNPKLLLLDEPTAQLDPVAAKDFIQMVYRLNQEFGLTVVIVEHRLEELFPLGDRVVFMEKGKVAYEGNPRDVSRYMWRQKDHQIQVYLPAIAQLYFAFDSADDTETLPLTVKEGRNWVEKMSLPDQIVKKHENTSVVNTILTAKAIHFQYEKNHEKILNHLDLTIIRNECLAIVGGNGSGKSTLLKVLGGLLSPQQGKVCYFGRKMKKQQPQSIAYLPQNPKLYFLHDTLEEEIKKVAETYSTQDQVKRLTSNFGLTSLMGQHPYDLSGGEMQKAALACVLLQNPKVLLVDEPTKGLDPSAKSRFGELLKELKQDGMTIVLVTHDVEFAAKYATRCAMMFQGAITATGTPSDFFKGNAFYTTMINRMTRNTAVPEVLTLEEAKSVWRNLEPSLER